MVKSTSFEKLHEKLEESFGNHGIPETITHDNGPPYNSRDWVKFSKKWGFKKIAVTPENPQANGVAERFMAVLAKVVHTAVASGQDPKVAVRRRLLNYRNTPHPSTGKTPAELMIRRRIRTRIPMVLKPAGDKVDMDAKEKNKDVNEKRKRRFDLDKHVKEIKFAVGDEVLMKQTKSSVKPPYDPNPYKVIKVQGTQITGAREGKEKKRNTRKVKMVPERPIHLRTGHVNRQQSMEEIDSDDDVEINLGGEAPVIVMEEGHNEGGGPEQQQMEGAGARTSKRKRNQPNRYADEQGEQQPKKKKQMSPQKRKKAQSAAKFKKNNEEASSSYVKMASGGYRSRRSFPDWSQERAGAGRGDEGALSAEIEEVEDGQEEEGDGQ